MVKAKFPKAVRDAFFDLEMGFNESGPVTLDTSVMKSCHVSLAAKGFYACARAKDPYNEFSIDRDLIDQLEPEEFEQIMDELIDEGIALRLLYAIDETPAYRIHDCKMECFLDFLTSTASDEDVDGCPIFLDYLDSLTEEQTKKLLSKVLP